MVEALLTERQEETSALERARTFVGMLRPDLLVDGHEPEQRAVCRNLSWEHYLALDKALGEDRSGPQLYYLDGTLEIMTISGEHERIKNGWATFWRCISRKLKLATGPGEKPRCNWRSNRPGLSRTNPGPSEK